VSPRPAAAPPAPRVSVIVPCRDHARFLPDAVASLRAQTMPSWECLVVDDGSIDDTPEVAGRLALQDSRVRVLRQEGRGCGSARNTGLDAARGQYVQFLDADDAILPTKLAAQLAALERAPGPALAICDYYNAPEHDLAVDDTSSGRYLSPRLEGTRPLVDLAARWERSLSIPAHCLLFDRRLFAGIRFDETLPSHEDWDCWLRVFALEPPVCFVDQRLAVYRRRAGSMSADRRVMRWTFLRAARRHRRALRHDPVLFAVLTAKLAEIDRLYRDVSPRGRVLRVGVAAGRAAARLAPAAIRRRLIRTVDLWLNRRASP